MVEKKSPVASKIAKILAMGIRFVPFGQCFGQGCGFCRFAGDTYIVKVNGMIEFVFQGDHNYRIIWHFFFNCNVDAQEKPNKKKAY